MLSITEIFILYYAQSNLGIFLRVWQFVVVFFCTAKDCVQKIFRFESLHLFAGLEGLSFRFNHRGASFCLLKGEKPEMFCIKSAKSF